MSASSTSAAESDVVHRWIVPGRVNLIGEHLDYLGGPCLPFAIDRGLTIKARRRDDDRIRVWSRGQHEGFGLDVSPGETDGWVSYPAGVVWAMRQAGHPVPGADIVVESDLPEGAGLSSSAALTCATACVLDAIADLGLGRLHLARLAQRAENDYVGAPTGLMDQLAVLFGRVGHVVRLVPAAEPPAVTEHVFDPAGAELTVLVMDTRAGHSHADGGYARRREETEQARRTLGLQRLADARPDDVLRLDDETLKARTRHVITETARVTSAVRALADGAWERLGTMLTASHASMRDDFAISCAELDVAVDAALEAGALGARMTGGGFGGSALALVPRHRVEAVGSLVRQRFETAQWREPRIFAVRPSDGAHPVLG